MTANTDCRILLVDDTEAIHEDFRKILAPALPASALDGLEAELLGGEQPLPAAARFALDSAFQGQEGVALAEAALRAGQPYALAFVDMRMPPGWDGLRTIEQLWRTDPRLQIVLCTAYSDHPLDALRTRLDPRDRLLVLKKPFDVIEVMQLACTLTAKWELARRTADYTASLERAVRELRATEGELRRTNRELDGFVHSAAHDLRSPLIAMGLYSSLLSQEFGSQVSPKAQHYLGRMRTAAAAGERLVEGLGVLARVARARLRPEAVDLSAIVRGMLAELQAAEPGRRVAVHVEDGLRANADRPLLQVALRHLLDNAWKFSSRQPQARIDVGAERGEGGCVFFVRDNGSGFDPAYVEKLFEGIQRLHAADEFSGAGVGLVTAGRIIARHGGRIWAESRPGEGATFRFTLAGPPPLGAWGEPGAHATGATP